MEKFSGSLNYDTKIAVLAGGKSSEREVSLRSGKNCFEALKRLGYKNTELVDVDKNIAKTLLDKEIEVAYIALHGKYGEDGCIQGLLEIIGIPYIGCGVKSSAIAMDKEFTKRILKEQRIPVINSVSGCTAEDFEDISGLQYPLMVKPIADGSSIGMSKVNSADELDLAIVNAIKCNSGVMIEEFIQGKSLTVGVIDMDSMTIATPILEFRTKTEWYDFEAKYTQGMTEFILPAEITEEQTSEIKDLAVKSHVAIGAVGMSRVDFVFGDNNKPYVLEINTIPGMTDLSDLPAQAGSMGIDYDNLVQIILNSAFLPKS